MKEPKLNEVFEHEGVKLKCVLFEEVPDCSVCYFEDVCSDDVKCKSLEREDGNEVNFIIYKPC